MSKLRIICRMPEGPDKPSYGLPLVNGNVPSIADCTVYLDGVEVHNVARIVFAVGGNEPATAG